MKFITPEWAEKNRLTHEDRGSFGGQGQRWVHVVSKICKENGYMRALDFGCGKGGFKKQMKFHWPCTVDEYDPAIEGKDTLPDDQNFDLIFCADVMEHIEPQYVDDVLDWIADHSLCAFFAIATKLSIGKCHDGDQPHVSVHPDDWWREKLEARWQGVNQLPSQREQEYVAFCAEPK